jgi:hypothetical protein
MRKSIILLAAALLGSIVTMAQTTVTTVVPAQAQDQTRARVHDQTTNPAQSQTSLQTQDRTQTRSQLHTNDQTGTKTSTGIKNKKQFRSKTSSGSGNSSSTVNAGARTRSSFNNAGPGSASVMNRKMGAGKGAGRR